MPVEKGTLSPKKYGRIDLAIDSREINADENLFSVEFRCGYNSADYAVPLEVYHLVAVYGLFMVTVIELFPREGKLRLGGNQAKESLRSWADAFIVSLRIRRSRAGKSRGDRR